MRFEYPLAWLGLLLVGGLLWWLRHQWRHRVGLDRAAFVVRALALLLLVVALSGPQMISRQPMRYVYFVVDRSASAAPESDPDQVLQELLPYVQQDERTRYGLIVFGREAFVDQPFAQTLPEHIQTVVDPSGSDLAGALRLALETLPTGLQQDAAGNVDVVLLSDGQVEARSLLGVLERARTAGVRIWVLPHGITDANDARLDAVQLPSEVIPDHAFEGVAYVHSNIAVEGTVLVYRNDELEQAISVNLTPGTNAIRFTDTLDAPGHYRYQVRLSTDADVLLENNVASDLVTVTGNASVLVLERPDRNGDALSRLLDAADYVHERRPWRGETLHLSDLSAYKAVVLNNVSINSLDAGSIGALKAYVGELGGGVWVVEGHQALEGVINTELEDMLPVTYEGPQREQLPGVAIVFVLDRSSSMGQAAAPGSGLTKLDVLKEAAANSIEVLRQGDSIGVLIFDSAHTWLVPLQALREGEGRKAIYDQLKQVFSGGGTDLLPPLAEAFEQLQAVQARIKHILVFSDGKTVRQDRDFEALFDRMTQSDVTVSSIGLGQQPDEEMLQRLADAGQGAMFIVRDVTELPKISVRETRRIVQRRWVVGDFPTEAGPFAQLRLSGMDIGGLPQITGYVRTFPKPLSQTAINVDGNPLLSFWQFGLGHVAVLNTDLDGVWTGNWTQWPQLHELVAEVLGQLYANPTSNTGLVLSSQIQGDTLHLELDALDGARWVNLLEIRGSLISEAGIQGNDEAAGIPVVFTQEAPGHYTAKVDHVQQGLNLINLEAKENAELAMQQSQVIAIPYPIEYQKLGINQAILEQIAASSGGAIVEDEQLDFGPLGSAGPLRYEDLWPWVLGLSMLFFLADLLLRKIPLDALLMGR